MNQSLHAAVLEHLNRGATLITPNNRLSRQLLQSYFQQQQTPWCEKPNCLPYQAFLLELFKQVRTHNPTHPFPLLLNLHQERLIWTQILQKNLQTHVPDGLLNAIQEAWSISQRWNTPIQAPAFEQTIQTRQFSQWALAFEHRLHELEAITSDQLVPYLLDHLVTLPHTTPLLWYCFDDYTPQQQCLQQALAAHGYAQQHHDLPPKTTRTFHYAATDPQGEWQQILLWLNKRLEAGDSQIGVVVPDLQTQSSTLKRLLKHHFPHTPVNLSSGLPLLNYPLMAHALRWLALDHVSVSRQVTQLLLQSPYLKDSQTEYLARAHLMQSGTLSKESDITWDKLLHTLSGTTPKLANLLQHATPYPENASPQEWVVYFKTRLHQLGFPGECALTSPTYQCYQRLVTLLEEFGALTSIAPILSLNNALEQLRCMASTTIFQEKRPPSRIHVLGLLEAAGCTFDSIWVCGLTDQCLPEKVRLSAYLPVCVQQEHRMPHALPERELHLAQQLLQRLQYGSLHSVFSYSRMTGDIPNMPCPLIVEFPAYPAISPIARPAPQLLTEEESHLIPLLEQEARTGSTRLLSDQAKCPFRAFAAHRLHAQRNPEPSTGPNPMERGQLLHAVMETLWNSIQTQEALFHLPKQQLQQQVEHAITQALAVISPHYPTAFPPLVQGIESQRLKALVYACLEWEKQRTPFTVEATEYTFTLPLAGLSFRLRIDRLDAVGEQKWVIDYKSRFPERLPWHDKRPEEPQLLLYALLDNQIDTLLYLQLKLGRLTCKGLSNAAIPPTGATSLKTGESWAEFQQNWQERLSQLALEFQAGYCLTAPQRRSTCERCEFQGLCRYASRY